MSLFDDRSRLGGILLEEDPAVDPVRHILLHLISNVRPRWHGEHLVDLLESKLLRLTNEAEYHEPSDKVEASVETESTGFRHDGAHAREREGKNTGKGVVDANNPGHALLTLDGGEHLGGVLESYGALAKRVEYGEEVDKEHDGAELCASGCGFGL